MCTYILSILDFVQSFQCYQNFPYFLVIYFICTCLIFHLVWYWLKFFVGASQVGFSGKESAYKAGDIRDMSLSLGQEAPLEEGMATLSSILARRIPWTEGPAG